MRRGHVVEGPGEAPRRDHPDAVSRLVLIAVGQCCGDQHKPRCHLGGCIVGLDAVVGAEITAAVLDSRLLAFALGHAIERSQRARRIFERARAPAVIRAGLGLATERRLAGMVHKLDRDAFRLGDALPLADHKVDGAVVVLWHSMAGHKRINY